MARKRASLKDKGAETLGLTPKKGKGIDVLFGGPAEPQTNEPVENTTTIPQPQAASAPVAEASSVDEVNDLSDLLENPVNETPAAVPPAPTVPAMPDSLPVNEADDDAADVISSEAMADDLDLPVAMDGPPPDLELATPIAEEVAVPLPAMSVAAETPPAISLDSLPAAEPVAVSPPPESLPPAAEPVPVPPPESLAPAVEPAPIPSPESLAPTIEPAPMPPVTPAMPANEADDNEDDLSGLDNLDDVAEIETDDELVGLPDDAAAPATLPPTNLPPGAPPADAAPASMPPAAEVYSPPAAGPAPTPYQPATYQPAAPLPTTTSAYTARPTPPSMGTPPSTATGARSLSMPRAKIESVGGIISEPMEVKEEDILPETTKLGETEDNIIGLKEIEEVDADEEMTRKVTRYVGSERRRKLDEEIEYLYDEVAQELSVNKEDSEFALKVLSQAQDIVFEDTRQYDEAFYLVSVVKTMIARKRNLRRWTYTWGSFVFIYAIVWLGAFIAGYILYDQIGVQIGNTSESVDAIRAAWFAALAGGIGGVIGILYSLYWHVAMKQDFDRQYVMYYMVQPVMGFILGAVVYFIIGSGFLVINFALPDSSDPSAVLASPTIIAIQIVLGWAAGFRQRFVFEMVDKIVQRVSPKEDDENTKKPESLVPEQERQRIQARINEKSKALPPTTPPPPGDTETVSVSTEA